MIPFANLANMWGLLINPRVGVAYLWGGCFDAVDHTVGADCSGCAGMVTASLQQGLNVVFQHYFSTMDFAGLNPGDVGPMGIVIVASLADIPPDAAVRYSILQDPNAEDAHIICAVPSTVDSAGNYGGYVTIESGGNENCLATGDNATAMDDPEFNQWGYLPGPIQDAPPPPPLTPMQLNALIVIAAGEAMGITPLGQTMGLCCALDESGMLMYANSNVPESLNYPHDAVGSDGMSCGPFQQQSTTGWGTVAQEMDWTASATMFFAALAKTDYTNPANSPGWRIQQVQRSGTPDGSNYDAQWDTAVALYNSVITVVPPPAPPEGFLMALTDQQQNDLYNAICGKVTSQASFRQLGEGANWEPAQFWLNDDGMTYDQYVYWAASLGDQVNLAILTEIAAGDVTKYPDRIEDIRLAQQALDRIGAGGTVTPAPEPVPVPVPAPVSPTPNVVPATPVTPGTLNINTAQIMGWVKDALTILGALGTWATAVHSALGQFLPGTAGAVVPALLAGGTTVLAGHTVRQKTVAQKQVVALKGG